MSDKLNAREELEAAEQWLGWQDEDLSVGLKSAEDGLKLWRYWQANPNLPEMADDDEEGYDVPAIRKQVLGYDPMDRALDVYEGNES
ncbi:hypothetical protein CPT_Sonora_087 [Stenotrophomonas phage Sonora]|nr:hypothetical protein CPT_Sonora_087 [Stenotrophomonas phage Sonora]